MLFIFLNKINESFFAGFSSSILYKSRGIYCLGKGGGVRFLFRVSFVAVDLRDLRRAAANRHT